MAKVTEVTQIVVNWHVIHISHTVSAKNKRNNNNNYAIYVLHISKQTFEIVYFCHCVPL